MNKNDIEIRSVETRFEAETEGRTIKGLAIPVNSTSELLYDNVKDRQFYEIILPEAVNEDLIVGNDVKVYLDHDASQGTFARSKYGEGTLKLTITERGLEFEFEAPNTVFGDMILEGIKRGDYDSMSYAFIPNPETEVITKNEDGTYNRAINEILWLGEISILSQAPAYEATTVAVRSIDKFEAEEAEKRNKILSKLNERLEPILMYELDNKLKSITDLV